MKECYLYKKLAGDKAQCQTCCHYCLIEPGKRGTCGVRENRGGKLYALNYGQPCALAVDPIEKKPLYHFLPGTETLSLATVGCNFACHSCQNWQISQYPKLEQKSINNPHLQQQILPIGRICCRQEGLGVGSDVSPKKIVDLALKYKTPSISYTYTEPTIFLEYALDIMKLAKETKYSLPCHSSPSQREGEDKGGGGFGLKNIWVSNGFMSPQTLGLILPYLDAANIDLKSFEDQFYQKYCSGRLQPVLDNLRALHKAKVHLEITTLVIPTLNDSSEIFKNIAQFIKNELSPEVPWHLSAFSPSISWKLQRLSFTPNRTEGSGSGPTPLATLEKAKKIGHRAGLKHIHLGNI